MVVVDPLLLGESGSAENQSEDEPDEHDTRSS
jgi:hypothetical protein